MSRFARFMLIVGVFAALFAVGSGMLVAYVLTHGSLVKVEVRQRSNAGSLDLDLPLPAGLVAAAIDLAAVAEAGEESRHLPPPGSTFRVHAWRPAARAACRALAGAPDGTLVQVESGPETVQVIKRGDTVEVQVHGLEGEVRVVTPAGLIWHLADLV
jgi:hypothetical protein